MKVSDKIVSRGANVAANRTVTLMKQLFDYALTREYVDSNPVVGIKLIHVGGVEKPKDRVLEEHEITPCLQSLVHWRTHESHKLAIRFILASGQRVGAVFCAKWQDINFDDKTWLIPASSHEYFTKSAVKRRLPLSNLMLDLLSQQKKFSSESVFVWPSVNDLTKRMIKDSLNSVVKRNDFGTLEPWTPHDLRRTVVTQMAEMSIPFHVSEKIVGHKMGGIMAVYNHYSYMEEQREALNKWGVRLATLESKNSEVVPLVY